MINWLLNKLNLVHINDIYAINIRLNETSMRLTDVSKTLKRIVIENDKKDKEITKLKNKLLMYEDPESWYIKYENKLSIIAAALLEQKEKDETNNK